MITLNSGRTVESTIRPLDEAKYTFDPDNMRHIAAILREMYSDPVMAVVREYAANATDAHTFAGKTDTPIDITVPTRDNPVFVVRDFGTGLPDEEVKRLLFGYASSGDEKRTSNDLIGGFGIGAKSGYAISDQFNFISRHKGIQSTWLCYRDQDDDCRAKKLSEKETVFDDGLEVSIPVSIDLIDDFQKAIAAAFRFYKVKPNLINASTGLVAAVTRPIPKTIFSGDVVIADKNGDKVRGSWEFIEDSETFFKTYDTGGYRYSRFSSSSDKDSFIVMGQVAYPLEFDKIGSVFRGTDTSFKGYILRLPIGSLQLAPSRESLSYTSRVKETLRGVVKVTLETIEKQIKERLAACLSSHDLFSLMKMVDENLPSQLKKVLEGKDIKEELAKRGLNWTGYEIPSTAFDMVIHGNSSSRYNYSTGHAKYFTVVNPFTDPSVRTSTINRFAPVVCVKTKEGDKVPKFLKELFSRVGSFVYPNMRNDQGINPLKDRPSFHVLVCRSDKLPDIPWLHDGSIKMVDFSDLPAQADATWVEAMTVPSRSSSSGRSSAGRNSYSQHSKKFALLKQEPRNYGSTKSEFWTAIAAKDLKDKEGKLVYVFHDRFYPVYKRPEASIASSLDGVFYTQQELKEVNASLFPELSDGVYGIRLSDTKWVEEQENLINIVDYVKESMDRIMKEYNVTLDQIRACYCLLDMSRGHAFIRGMVPWFLGASMEDNDTGLYQYLNIFRKHPELIKYVSIFLRYGPGSCLRDTFGLSIPFRYEKGELTFEDGVDKNSDLNQKLFNFAERCVSTQLRKLLIDSIDSTVQYENDSIDDLNTLGKKDSEIKYRLLLEMEKLGL